MRDEIRESVNNHFVIFEIINLKSTSVDDKITKLCRSN